MLSFMLHVLVATQMVHAAPISMPEGESVGSPNSLQVEFFENSGPLANLETITDILPDDEGIEGWSDAQVEEFYRDQLDFAQYWLDRVQESALNLNHIGEYQTAGSGGRAGLSAIACMSLVIQGEAGGEPMAGKIAVGETVMARAKGNPAKVCSVVFARGQFESMTKRKRKPSADCVRAAHTTIKKGGKCGYDYFLSKSLQRALGRRIPTWAISFERRGCASKKIGVHTFYSSCNCRRRG